MILKAILYCEFDNVSGSKILFQYPQNFITNEVFDTFSEYIITKTQFCNKLITFTHDNELLFMGIPQCIEGKQYERNALLFNVVFVFDKPQEHNITKSRVEHYVQQHSVTIETETYKPIVRKVAFLFRSLEFLSNYSTKASIEYVLAQIINDLNTKGETAIPIDESHAINLRLVPRHLQPTTVYAHHVPFPLCNIAQLVNEEWDQTIQQIIPFIDGINFVKQIAFKSSVHIELVKKCIQHLLYYGLVEMVDIFQFSNMYTLQSKHIMLHLFRDKYMQEECLSTVVQQTEGVVNNISPSGQIHDILKLYCAMKSGVSLSQIFVGNQHLPLIPMINPRALIVFGLLRGFLRRVHEYPVIHAVNGNIHSPSFEIYDQQLQQGHHETDHISRSASSEQLGNAYQHRSIDMDLLQSLADGRHSYDEICVELSISRRELVRALEQLKNCYTILH